MANDLQILSTTDKYLILWNVVSTASPKYSVRVIANLESEMRECIQSGFNALHISSGSLMPAIYIQFNNPMI